jgi:hypothetical protein
MKPVYYDWFLYANYSNMFGIKKIVKHKFLCIVAEAITVFQTKCCTLLQFIKKKRNLWDVFGIIIRHLRKGAVFDWAQTQLFNNHSSFNEGLSWLLVKIGRSPLRLCHCDMSYCLLTSVLSNIDFIFIFFIESVMFFFFIHIIHLLKSVSASIILVFYIRIVNFSNSIFTYWSYVILGNRLIELNTLFLYFEVP